VFAVDLKEYPSRLLRINLSQRPEGAYPRRYPFEPFFLLGADVDLAATPVALDVSVTEVWNRDEEQQMEATFDPVCRMDFHAVAFFAV
jgi:hypothetical protein